MENLEKGLVPSKLNAIPKLSSSGFEENNENHSIEANIIPKSPNYKRTVAKHFMSPTISASSNALVPRKKILSERSGNSRNSQNHKMSSKKSPQNFSNRFSSGNVSLYENASEPEDNGCTDFLDDLSVEAYDPMKNYLSLRPKYLRFDQNRRSEILIRLEREKREELKSSFESGDDEESSSSEPIEDPSLSPPIVQQEIREKTEENDENIDENEEEEEDVEEGEFEEEREWCVGGLLKLLLTLIGCFLTTSYICTMNSPAPSQTQQAMWNPREGCVMIKNHTLEFVPTKMHENKKFEPLIGAVSDETVDAMESSFMDLNEEDVYNGKSAKTEIIGGGVDSEAQNFVESIGFKADESEDVGGSVTAMEIEGSGKFQEVELPVEPVSEETQNESTMVEVDEELTSSEADESKGAGGSVMAIEIEGSGKFQEVEHSLALVSEETQNESTVVEVDEELTDELEVEKATWNTLVVIGVSIVSIISASLAFIYHTKFEKKYVMEERETSSVPSIERKVEFLARPTPPSSYPPMGEAFIETNCHVNAPSVELISEITFVKAINSLRISEERQMAEREAIKATTVEHSPSHGSFTSERKKSLKKVEFTPVRRSNRLRSRAAVTSP